MNRARGSLWSGFLLPGALMASLMAAVAQEVEWLGRGKDVSALAGKTVRLVFRMRGSSLYALQFEQREQHVR